MTRKSVNYFKTDLNKNQARDLVEQVFDLQKELSLSYQQMAGESGLSVDQLYRLKCLWLNGKGKQKKLSFTIANKLVKFWNNNLQTQPREEEIEEDITMEVIKIMLQKGGLKHTRLLLKRRGKLHLLQEYLKTLSPAKLSDLL